MNSPLIELENVSRHFQVKRNTFITAVSEVSLQMQAGEIVCLVGESGCGKTTTGKMIAGLLPPSQGQIRYQGQDISQLKGNAWQEYRLGVQLIHQDPYASLNPSHTIYDILAAPLQKHRATGSESATRAAAVELLESVDLTPAADLLDKFPHQLSGGQRQRVAVARALTVNPKFIVADEAVSMVDVSIRISLLNTLLRLQQENGLAVLFITHDLALAKYFACEGRVGVMYLGRMVEIAPARQLVQAPQHPYTRVLLSAIPEADPQRTRTRPRLELRSMDVPSLLNLPSGCAFHPRCPFYLGEICQKSQPALNPRANNTWVACHLDENA